MAKICDTHLMEKTYSLILFGTNKEQYFAQSIEQLNIQIASCQKYFKENITFNVILVKDNTLNISVFEEIRQQLTEEIILLKAMYYPDSNWLINMIQSYQKQNHSLLLGDVISNKFLPNFSRKTSSLLFNNITNIFDNCMVDKKFFEVILSYLSLVTQGKESWIYERIFKELEAEIVYNDKIKVFKK